VPNFLRNRAETPSHFGLPFHLLFFPKECHNGYSPLLVVPVHKVYVPPDSISFQWSARRYCGPPFDFFPRSAHSPFFFFTGVILQACFYVRLTGPLTLLPQFHRIPLSRYFLFRNEVFPSPICRIFPLFPIIWSGSP